MELTSLTPMCLLCRNSPLVEITPIQAQEIATALTETSNGEQGRSLQNGPFVEGTITIK